MLFAGISTAVRLGANLVLLPILIHKLQPSELAMWWALVALGGLATLADLGFGQAITRAYSYLWAGAEDFGRPDLKPVLPGATPNLQGLRVFHSSVRRLYTLLTMGGFVALATGGTAFLVSSEEGQTPTSFWLLWICFIVAVVFAFRTSHWSLACQGINKIRELQIANLWAGLTYVISAAGMLLMDLGLWSLPAAFFLRALVAWIFCARTYLNALPQTPSRTPADIRIVKRMWPDAWKFGLLSLGVYLVNNGPVLISKHFLDDTITASFGLTSQAGLILVSFSSLWLSVKWPEITILRTQGNLSRMSVLFAQRLGLALASFLIAAIAILLWGNSLLEWKGTSTRLLATPYLAVYLLYLWQQIVYGSFANLTFTENVVPFYLLASGTGLGVVILGTLVTPVFGLWGLILAPLIVAQFGNSWYPIIRGFRGQSLPVTMFLRTMLGLNHPRP